MSNPAPAVRLPDLAPFRLGRMQVDPAAHEVRYGDTTERIQPQPVRLLVALASSPGALLSREAIIDRCWDGRIVGDDVINRAVLILRGVAKRSGAFRIETIPRAGYRLLLENERDGGRDKRTWLIVLAVAVASLAAIAALGLRSSEPARPSVTIAPIISHVRGAEGARLAADVRSALTHALVDSGSTVRSVPKKADYSINAEITESNGRIRAVVQLEDLRRHLLIVSRQFDRPRAFAHVLPQEIAASIAANLSTSDPLLAVDRRHPADPAVISNLLNIAYLHGTQGDPFRAYEIAQRTAAQAPGSALAQVGLAVSSGFLLEALPEHDRPAVLARGRAAAQAADRLAADFGDSAFLWCLLHPHVLLAQCEAKLREGLGRHGNQWTTAINLSTLLMETGQYEESLRMAEMASAADPYNPIKRDFLIQALQLNGRTKEAAAATALGLRYWPDHQPFIWNQVLGLSARGDFGGLRELDRTTADNLIPYERGVVTAVLAAVQTRDASTVRRECTKAQRGSTRQVCLAALSKLGDLDFAFRMADELYPRAWGRDAAETERLWLQRPGAFPLTFLSSYAAAPMRADRRFRGVAERSGLIEYWRKRPPDFCRTGPAECRKLLGG